MARQYLHRQRPAQSAARFDQRYGISAFTQSNKGLFCVDKKNDAALLGEAVAQTGRVFRHGAGAGAVLGAVCVGATGGSARR